MVKFIGIIVHINGTLIMWFRTIFGSHVGVVGWCKGVVYLTSLGRPIDIGLQLGKACYPCNR